ncbi:MAG: hypothetical protein HKN81_09555 [Gammaproteobacteria bacterium]|nr:hypothetical protein [Gammaproteobacteria bacterium]
MRDYLQRHPGIEHEWHRIDNGGAGSRTELICGLDSDEEVIATLRRDAIVIGDKDGSVEFDDLGKELSPLQLATKALAHLIKLRDKKGYGSNEES